MTRTIYRERIPSTDPRLRRHVNHDSESKRYAFPTEGLSIVSAVHTRHIPVLNQGNVGSCTGNAGVGCMATDPYYATVTGAAEALLATGTGRTMSRRGTPMAVHYSLDEAGAVQLYSDAETIDGDGPYPPNDNGSSGLSIAQALKNAGEISGYTHTFSLDDALKAFGVTAAIIGVNWYNAMFTPDADGRVHPDQSSGLAGGHEIVVDEIDATAQQVWLTNSWGDGWGVQRGGRGGRFYLTFTDLGQLLNERGDVTIFTPLDQPAPTPTPSPDADPDDVAFANVLRTHDWVHKHHVLDNAKVAAAGRIWLAKKGL